MKPVNRAALMASPANFLALGAGTGLAPYAPGTVATAACMPLLWLMPADPWLYAGVVVVLFAIGVLVCDVCSRWLGVHDHSAIVWDEWVGYFITMFMVPPGVVAALLGFLLFRLFDIWKPWPIRQLDRRVHGGLGIMIDDVIAGVFALIVLQAVLRLTAG